MPRRTSRRDLEAALANAHGQLRRHERELQKVREEADVLREAAETLIHHAPARERFAFVHELRDRFPVRRICRIIATDHSSYFAWARAEKTRIARKLDDEQLLQLIIMASAFSRGETDESDGVGAVGCHVSGGLGDVVPAG